MLKKARRVFRSVFADEGEHRSLAWTAVVNGVAGSHAVGSSIRTAIYRASGISIAWSARVRPGVIIRSPRLTIGRRTTINYGCVFDNREGVAIGSDVGVGIGVRFINSDHDIDDPTVRAGRGRSAPISVASGVFIGSGVTVLSGVTIRQGCVVAAGAVVRESTDPHGLYVGVPARRVRDLPTAAIHNSSRDLA